MNPGPLADEPQYLQRYAYELCKLHDLHKPAHWMTLLAIATAGGGSGVVEVTREFRKELMNTIGCGPMWVGHALAECTTAGLLEHLAGDSYRANAAFFADGAWEEVRRRQQRLVMVVVFGPEGRTLVEARRLTHDEARRFGDSRGRYPAAGRLRAPG